MLKPSVTWVLHAGLQDIELLVERFGSSDTPALFDTQIAWGLQGPESSVSLSYLQYKVVGVRSMKTHQADDWMRRPLPAAQLEYAAKDIEHLPAIHGHLLDRLRALGRDDVIDEVCRELLVVEPEPSAPMTLASFRNAWQLDPKAQTALRFMIDWHERLSSSGETIDLPPKAFLSVASRMPRSAQDLGRIKGVPHRFTRHHGERFVRKLQKALRDGDGSAFVPIEPPPYATFEEIQLDGWLAWMRAEVSARIEIAPEIAIGSRLLKRLRQMVVESGDRSAGAEAFTGWRARVVRPAYLELSSEVADRRP
jgi:ribonuclease D